jgi:mitochondrial-processing peptidase subunit alpha
VLPDSSLPFDLSQPAHYTGGFLSIPPVPNPTPTTPPLTHIHLAFESPPITSPDIYAVAVLQMLLGGGGSFSAGGPGKGMYSRLYTSVLNQHAWVESCVAFNHGYADSGLFGVAASCGPQHAASMLDVICRELAALAADPNARSGPSAGGVGRLQRLHGVEVERAKNQLRSNLLMNLESRLVELEDLGRQVQTHGRRIGVAEMCERIDAITVEDLRRTAESMFCGAVETPGRGTGLPTVVLQEAEGFSAFKGGWQEIQERIYKAGLGRR